MQRIGAPIERASKSERALFDEHFVEEVFHVEETAFDADRLRDSIARRCLESGVTIRTGVEVRRLVPRPGGVEVELAGAEGSLLARDVFVCAYSRINVLLAASQLPLVPLKHEMTEMCLVEVPEKLRRFGITVMCGPFFSCMPFPPRAGLHTLSHVRYTPHYSWHDDRELHYDSAKQLEAPAPRSHFAEMSRDARRYVPALRDASHRGSIWEVKTLLPRSERDDGRPIFFGRDHGAEGVHVVLGGKIDNVFDVVEEVGEMIEAKEATR
jgi:glycine/D-amino acid oxidase-like deaminating enzyme